MLDDFILETSGLSKAFDGHVVVRGLELRVRRQHVHALIGPNGAGKTTVFNMLSKLLEPSSGRIRFKGEDITATGPAQVARRGLARSFQLCAVFPRLSALENVRAALQRRHLPSFQFWRSERVLHALDERALALLDDVGLCEQAETPAADLPYGHKRALEVATTLALDPDLVLLDEPTQGMGRDEIARVTGLIRKVAHRRTVVLVEHNMDVVADVADTISVLAGGKLLTEGNYAEVSRDARVLEAYMGASEDSRA